MARTWSKRRILAKLAELTNKPASAARSQEYADLLLAVMEEATPAQQEWFVSELLDMVVARMPVAERHKFLTDLVKQSLN